MSMAIEPMGQLLLCDQEYRREWWATQVMRSSVQCQRHVHNHYSVDGCIESSIKPDDLFLTIALDKESEGSG